VVVAVTAGVPTPAAALTATATPAHLPRPSGNDDNLASLSRSVATLSKEVESQRKENSKLQKCLSDALRKIAKLDDVDDLHEQELGNAHAQLARHDVQKELDFVKEQNKKLHKALDKTEMKLSTKDDNLDSIVEEHIEQVEFLERTLEEAEDELFKMEVSLKKAEAQEKSNTAFGIQENFCPWRLCTGTDEWEPRQVGSQTQGLGPCTLHHASASYVVNATKPSINEASGDPKWSGRCRHQTIRGGSRGGSRSLEEG
jgi:hypothetical protein